MKKVRVIKDKMEVKISIEIQRFLANKKKKTKKDLQMLFY